VSSVEKLADKAFIIGFYLPSLLALIAFVYAFPGTPGAGIIKHVEEGKTLTDLTYFVLAVWVFAVLLVTLNSEIYRLLEGYFGPFAWMPYLKRWHVRKFTELKYKSEKMRNAWKEAGEAYPSQSQRLCSKLVLRLVREYPTKDGDFLPTAFGNRIRSFEVYSRDVFGAESVCVWDRLGAIIPKEFLDSVNDARAQVDFLVNISVLAFVLAMLSAAAAIGSLMQGQSIGAPVHDGVQHYVMGVGIASLVCYSAYRWATERVSAWGTLVKSAFDLYLSALAKQLGYSLPPDSNRRRSFWEDYSRQATYNEIMNQDIWLTRAGRN
jgi:hypothetical protein